jgi:hypothetical protein
MKPSSGRIACLPLLKKKKIIENSQIVDYEKKVCVEHHQESLVSHSIDNIVSTMQTPSSMNHISPIYEK